MAEPAEGDIGYYKVHVNVDGVNVYFDDQLMGVTKDGVLMVPVLISGPRYTTLYLEKVGYRPYQDAILSVPTAGNYLNIYATMTVDPMAANGTLNLRVNPAGPAVYIDGVLTGRVGVSGVYLDNSITSGNHEISLQMNGYNPYTMQVYISPNMITSTSATLIPLTTGILELNSNPQGAGVYLDDQYQGITPLTLPSVAAGQHRLLFRAGGFQDYVMIVDVNAGSTVPVSVLLQANPTTPVSTPAGGKTGLPLILPLCAIPLAGLLFILHRTVRR
jgi:hypothetical protein